MQCAWFDHARNSKEKILSFSKHWSEIFTRRCSSSTDFSKQYFNRKNPFKKSNITCRQNSNRIFESWLSVVVVFVVNFSHLRLGTIKHPWVKRIQVFRLFVCSFFFLFVCFLQIRNIWFSKWRWFFSSLNQCYGIIIVLPKCVYW